MSDRRYPPITIEIPDRDTGELRRVELNYSTMTTPIAYTHQRQLRYFDAVIHQWLELLKNVIEKDAESSAYSFKRDEKYKEAV